MTRRLQVYPKASITGSEWTYVLKVYEHVTGVQSRFEHVLPAAVTVTNPLGLLKLVFDLVVEDGDTDQDVDDALFLDDIKPGGGVETVWGNWQELAETFIGSLPPDATVTEFWALWAPNNTNAVRADANRALNLQRGWTIVAGSVHQHEGDGTVSEL